MNDFKLPWEVPPANVVHDPALDTGGVDPSVQWGPAPINPLLVRDSVTGLWPGQQVPGDIPAFLRRQKT